MKGVRAGGGIGVVACWRHAVRVGEESAVKAGGTFAVVINRRVENLLAEAGELHVRQAFDLVEEIVDLRRGVSASRLQLSQYLLTSTNVFGCGFSRVVALKKIVQHKRVGLIVDQRLDVQIRGRRGLPAEINALAVFGIGRKFEKPFVPWFGSWSWR